MTLWVCSGGGILRKMQQYDLAGHFPLALSGVWKKNAMARALVLSCKQERNLKKANMQGGGAERQQDHG